MKPAKPARTMYHLLNRGYLSALDVSILWFEAHVPTSDSRTPLESVNLYMDLRASLNARRN